MDRDSEDALDRLIRLIEDPLSARADDFDRSIREAERARDKLVSFGIGKGVEKAIEQLIGTAIDIAKGLKAAPAVHVGKEIITGTAGAGEEEAIFQQQLQDAVARGQIAAIRLALLLHGRSGISGIMVARDP